MYLPTADTPKEDALALPTCPLGRGRRRHWRVDHDSLLVLRYEPQGRMFGGESRGEAMWRPLLSIHVAVHDGQAHVNPYLEDLENLLKYPRENDDDL